MNNKYFLLNEKKEKKQIKIIDQLLKLFNSDPHSKSTLSDLCRES